MPNGTWYPRLDNPERNRSNVLLTMESSCERWTISIFLLSVPGGRNIPKIPQGQYSATLPVVRIGCSAWYGFCRNNVNDSIFMSSTCDVSFTMVKKEPPSRRKTEFMSSTTGDACTSTGHPAVSKRSSISVGKSRPSYCATSTLLSRYSWHCSNQLCLSMMCVQCSSLRILLRGGGGLVKWGSSTAGWSQSGDCVFRCSEPCSDRYFDSEKKSDFILRRENNAG
ncbi:hypothetical protein BC629DRAFT_1488604 [Irpex lacteus]|nr:hypothetical protein BC629DRAFT_1488604 [Irpex lacteus]